MKRTFILRAPLVLALITAISMLGAQAAAGFTAVLPPFIEATSLVTGFVPCSGTPGIGPTGLLDDGTNLYVTDYCNAATYRFSEAGGDVSTAQASSVNGLDFAVADAAGHYYGASAGASSGSSLAPGIYEFDPATLAVTRTVTTALPGRPRQIAVDPLTGDLFVTMSVGGIEQIANPALNEPLLSNFVSTADAFDGAGFSATGSVLYVADSTTGHILGFDRTGHQVFDVDLSADHPDGLAVAPANRIINGVDVSGNVFVNNKDGTIVRIDTNTGNATSIVASGGTRGDLMTVDAQGYLDADQSDSVVRFYPPLFAVPPRNTGLPTIAGTPTRGHTLTCSPGTWMNNPLTYAYAWRLNGLDTGVRTAAYLVPASAPGQAAITCSVTVTNADGAATATSKPDYVFPTVGPLMGPRRIAAAAVFCRARHLASCHGIRIAVNIYGTGHGAFSFDASRAKATARTRQAGVSTSGQLLLGSVTRQIRRAGTAAIVFKRMPSARAAALERQLVKRHMRSIVVAFRFVSASGQIVTQDLRIALR